MNPPIDNDYKLWTIYKNHVLGSNEEHSKTGKNSREVNTWKKEATLSEFPSFYGSSPQG